MNYFICYSYFRLALALIQGFLLLWVFKQDKWQGLSSRGLHLTDLNIDSLT